MDVEEKKDASRGLTEAGKGQKGRGERNEERGMKEEDKVERKLV